MRYVLACVTVTVLILALLFVLIGAYFCGIWYGLGSTAFAALLTITVISLESA